MRKLLGALDRVLFPGRMRVLLVLLAAFVIFNGLVRVGLALFDGERGLLLPWHLLPALGVGLAFDIGAACFLLAILAPMYGLWPERRLRALAWVTATLMVPLTLAMVFVGVAEFTFWNEFASRFNFIAVDYLVYTREVMGNIRESYNLPLLLGGVGLGALLCWAALVGRARRSAARAGASLRGRAIATIVWMLSPVVAAAALDERYKEFSPDAHLSELAGNGYFDFWSAFRHNEIDYDRFYRTLPKERALSELAREFAHDRPVQEVGPRPYERAVAADGPERHLNVVLISVESLSAEFLGAFGNTQGLTPNLDRLAREGQLYTHLYATGTRTVRGLEALTLSIPPTPGHAIVKRPHNDHLFTIGEVFHEKGYEPLFLYGGYGYFDNMSAFFAGNGYTVVDRTALAGDEITHENIWGVADEDLFRLAVRELDARHDRGTPFFAHIMTTSNHRPFTYPAGRIDIPSKTGREGAVKYTDYAIGHFIDEARTRPWFDRTVFVIVADHTHKGRGRVDIPIENYHIPMIVYSPAHVRPAIVDTVASQIDVGPTIFGLLNFRYTSPFFGHDILRDGPSHPRALMANYQTVGYFEQGIVVELKPAARVRVLDAASGREHPDDALARHLVSEAISYYQVASEAYRSGQLRIAPAPRR